MSVSSTAPSSSMFQRLLHKQLQTAIESPYLALLFVGSLFLSFASFFTTFGGMLQFMPIYIITFFITFAVQSVLFVTSWRIGFMFADKEPISWLDLIIFAICFSISVFFSFSSLFDYIYKPEIEQKTSLTRVHDTVEESINELEIFNAQRQKDLVKDLLSQKVYQKWHGNVLKVSEAAINASIRLRDILKARSAERNAEFKRIQSESGEIVGSKSELLGRIDYAKQKIDNHAQRRLQLLAQIMTLEGKQADIEQETNVKQTERDAEASGGSVKENRVAGKGPVWRRLNSEYKRLLEQQKGAKRQLDAKNQQLESADKETLRLKNGLRKAEFTLNNIDVEIAESQSRAKKAKLEQLAIGSEVFDPQVIVAKLRAKLDEFNQTFDLVPFDQAATVCETLLSEMNRYEDLRDSVTGLSCARGGMEIFLKSIADAGRDVKKFSAQCSLDGAEAKDINRLSFDESVAHGRYCLSLTALPSRQIKPLRNEIARLEREESPNASKFTKTANAIMAGEKLAWFALLLAVSIDAIVLFSGLIGANTVRSKLSRHIGTQSDRLAEENIFRALDIDLTVLEDDAPRIRVIKRILHVVDATPKPYTINNVLYDAEINLNNITDPQSQKDVKQSLVAFSGKGYALPDQTQVNLFYFQKGFLDALRHELQEQQSRKFVNQAENIQPYSTPLSPQAETVQMPFDEHLAPIPFRPMSQDETSHWIKTKGYSGDAVDPAEPVSAVATPSATPVVASEKTVAVEASRSGPVGLGGADNISVFEDEFPEDKDITDAFLKLKSDPS